MSEHPAFKRTWWLNLYPDGQVTGTLCRSKQECLNRSTYTGDVPDGVPTEVTITRVGTTQRDMDYRLRIGQFVMNRLEEVKNKIGGVIGYRLRLSADETEKLLREIEKP